MENLHERITALEVHARTVQRQLRLWQGASAGLIILGLTLLPLRGVTAQVTSPSLDDVAARVATLETEVASLKKTVVDHATHLTNLDARVTAVVTDLAGRITSISGRVDPLEAKLSHVTVETDANDYRLVIAGANVQIRNGMGSTQTTNGLGNLIIGYNEPRGGTADNRSGSHNLVLGSMNNYTSYGGLVAGYRNESDGIYSSVTAGVNNTASGPYSSVAGGGLNLASGYASSISGGQHNHTDALCGSISGCYGYWQQGDKFNGWHVTNFDTGANGLPEKPGPQ